MNYPAGAENDSNAPYNESNEVKQCLECNIEIDDKDYCSSCLEYLEREEAKKAPLQKLQQIINLYESHTNIYVFNKLKEIKKDIEKL